MAQTSRARARIAVLGSLFVLTGAAALVVEQALEKLLVTVVGATTVAGSLVLSTYFVGLAVGGLGYPLLRRRTARTLRVFALLELTVGATAAFYALGSGGLQTA